MKVCVELKVHSSALFALRCTRIYMETQHTIFPLGLKSVVGLARGHNKSVVGLARDHIFKGIVFKNITKLDSVMEKLKVTNLKATTSSMHCEPSLA